MHTLIAAGKAIETSGRTWLALAIMLVGACLSAVAYARQMRQRGKVGRYAIGGILVAVAGILLLLSGK
jgi:hypothetical protein